MKGSDNLGVVIVLVIFLGIGAFMLARSYQASEKAYPPYSTYSPKAAGLQGFFELLEGQGYAPQRFADSEYDRPADSAMVLAFESAPDFSMLMGFADERALRLWLEGGGRLLLACDRGSTTLEKFFTEELELDGERVYEAPPGANAARGIGGQPGEISALSRVYKPGEVYRLEGRRPQLFGDVKSIETATPHGTFSPKLDTLLGSYDPQLNSPTTDPLVLYTPVGKGEVVWLVTPEILTNHWISRLDNHRLALDLVSFITRPAAEGGARLPLYFDEGLHGYGRDSSNGLALLTQTNGGRLLLLASALLVVLFLGAAIRPARFYPLLVPQRRQAREMVLAQADLYKRAGARFSLAESLVDGLKRAWAQSRHTAQPPSDRVLLDWLEKNAAHETALIDFLRSKIMPPVPRRLLEIAQSCDRLRHRLEQGAI